jgi:hypothetical protein
LYNLGSGADIPQVAITVTNAGGAPVSVTKYGVSMDGKACKDNLLVTVPVPWSTRLPFSVEPGGKPAELRIPVYELRHVHQERGVPFTECAPGSICGWTTLLLEAPYSAQVARPTTPLPSNPTIALRDGIGRSQLG